MEIRIDAKSFILIGVMLLRCKFHHRRKFRLSEKFLDTFQNIPVEHIKRLATDYDLVLSELALAWEAVDQPVELTWSCVRQTERFTKLTKYVNTV